MNNVVPCCWLSRRNCPVNCSPSATACCAPRKLCTAGRLSSVGIANSGPSDARNVVVQVQPQSGLLISAGSGSGSYDADTGRWSIPVVASGGAGTPQHFADALTEGKADAVLAASRWHDGDLTIREVKDHLASRGVPVRL